MDSPIDVTGRRRRVARISLFVVAGALLVVGVWTFRWWAHRDDPVPVTVTFQHCANPDHLDAEGSAWESATLGPSSWGGDEPGHLDIDGDVATFRSDLDGQTIAFQRVKFSNMTCRGGPRP
jgi:hypothetical protein